MLRAFDPKIEQLAKQCFDNPVVDDTFVGLGAVEGGATGSLRVVLKSRNMSAYVKPAKPPYSDLSCIANEKVASDLAYLAGLPVVPMQIIQNHGNNSLPSTLCASYLALPQGRPWPHSLKLSPSQEDSIRDGLSAMYAFCAWIGDSDHNWNDGNVIIERFATSAKIAFIDFSYSFTKWWTPPADPTLCHTTIKAWHNSIVDNHGLIAGAGAIEKLADGDITGILDRIPQECLAHDRRHAYVEALKVRQGKLRKLLGV